MTQPAASFVWYELMTTDPAAAEVFYRSVHGWSLSDAGLPGRRYTIIAAGGVPMGGMMELPAAARAAGAVPGWIGYVGVADVDVQAARFKEAGGVIHHPAETIPGVGRFAVVADPQGAVLTLFRGALDLPQAKPSPETQGRVMWHELHGRDGAAAFDFYAGQFGWTRDQALDMGPMGIYQLFTAGEGAIGGLFTDPAAPRPYWLYYFTTDDVDAAGDRVKAGGGQILSGPQQVPGGAWILNCADPQGALFGIVGARR